MRLTTTCAVVALGALTLAQSGWNRYRVTITNDAEAQRVTDCELGLFSDNVTLGYTDLIVGPGEVGKLLELRLPTSLVGELPDPRNWASRRGRAVGNYRAEYMRYDDIIAQYEIWRAQYPTLVTRQSIGTTIQGRNLWAYRVFKPTRDNIATHSVIFNFGIHAREWISPAVGMHLFVKLCERFAGPGQVDGYFPPGTAYYFIPVLNADGYEYTWTNNRMWRKNRRANSGGSFGVDLNRNFSTGWGGSGSSGNQNSETYRGTAAFSEPESVALRNLLLAAPNPTGFIDFHSYGQYVLWAWGYTTTPAPGSGWLGDIGAATQGGLSARFGTQWTIGPTSTTLYLASGVTPDYAYQQFNAAAFTIELRDTGANGFILPPSQITPSQDEAWDGFIIYNGKAFNR